ncbi:MAG: hypothetical protein Kow00122_11570 [Thermoleophilia bacterium]
MDRFGRSSVRRGFLLLIAALVIELLAAGSAWAATPQDVYDDFAADGRLDGSYTDAELQAVLSDPTLAQYADPDILGRLTSLIRGRSGDRSVFPFTGAEMAAIFGGGVALILLGVVLRRGRRGGQSS